MKRLYAGLRAKCVKFCNYVIAKSRSGDWEEIAHKFDWQCAELENLKKTHPSKSQYWDQVAKPILDNIANLSQGIDSILHDLEVFISAIDRTVEIVLNNKDSEEVEVLDAEDVVIEQEAVWLLHRWIQTTEEVKQINSEIKAVQENFDDFVLDHAMSKAMRQVMDKDA